MFEQHLYPPSEGRTIRTWEKPADSFASLSHKSALAIALTTYFFR
jgi:hypothetical protein